MSMGGGGIAKTDIYSQMLLSKLLNKEYLSIP